MERLSGSHGHLVTVAGGVGCAGWGRSCCPLYFRLNVLPSRAVGHYLCKLCSSALNSAIVFTAAQALAKIPRPNKGILFTAMAVLFKNYTVEYKRRGVVMVRDPTPVRKR